MYAILRVEKLKTLANVRGANSHNTRLEDTPNADPSKDNMYWGAKDPAQRIQEIWKANNIRVRKNAVAANEYMIGASPEFWHDKSKSDIKKWAKDVKDFLQEKHGDGLIQLAVHLDETSPHIQAIVTPIYENEKGQMKLSAKHFFDNPRGNKVPQSAKKLENLQTEFAEYIQKRGWDLERGIKGSKAKHKEIKKYYGELESEVKKATAETKQAIKEFKELKDEKITVFNAKSMFTKAFDLVIDLTKKLANIEKLNAALQHRFSSKIEQLNTQFADFRRDHHRLEHLYELQGLRNDPEAWDVLQARTQADAQERQQSAAQELSEGFDGLTPAQRAGIDNGPIVDELLAAQTKTPNRPTHDDAPGLG